MNNLNATYLRIIVDALRDIAHDVSHDVSPEDGYRGICGLLKIRINAACWEFKDPGEVSAATIDLWYATKDAILARWVDFSGDTVYPVPPTAGYGDCPCAAYDEQFFVGALWKGAQGELRRDLLAHLIDGFESLLSQAQQEAL